MPALIDRLKPARVVLQEGADRGVEVVVGHGSGAVVGGGPHRFVADSGGKGVGVGAGGGTVGPGAGYGVESEVIATFLEASSTIVRRAIRRVAG